MSGGGGGETTLAFPIYRSNRANIRDRMRVTKGGPKNTLNNNTHGSNSICRMTVQNPMRLSGTARPERNARLAAPPRRSLV